MSTLDGSGRAKLPHRGATVTVSSRRLPASAGSSIDSKGEQITEKNWTLFASCRGMPTRNFFPLRTDPRSVMQEARAVCSTCRVKKRCLLLALDQVDDDHGIFGGLAPKQRREVRHLLRSDPNYLSSRAGIERYGLQDAY